MPPIFKNLGIRRAPTPAQQAASRLEKDVANLMKVDGVFEGGGALGTAYVGSLRALYDNGLWFARVAGNSAGAITASMIAAGFTAHEIQWLSSAFAHRPRAPESLSIVGIKDPIDFGSFLDLPTLSSVSRSSKRKTILWKALKGTVIDEIGKTKIPVPIQSDMVNVCELTVLGVPLLGSAIRAVPGGVSLLRSALNSALAPLPNSQLHVDDLPLGLVGSALWNTESLRSQLADALWDEIAKRMPLMLIMTNFVHEGSIFEGDVFLRTMKRLLGRKVHNDPEKIVRFSDLKIPLAVIVSNIATSRMQVYDSNNYPNTEVAEAVRMSMSIPFIFQPRGQHKDFVDGGLCSNFPLWLFTDRGEEYWPSSSVDNNRVKIGFSLNQTKDAGEWNVQPARFEVTGNPPRVYLPEVLRPILEDKLIDLGYSREVATVHLAEAFGGVDIASGENEEPGIEILQQAFGVTFRGILNTEESTREFITEGLMRGRRYVDISIPLLGFDGLDFEINKDESALFAIWDRGWRAATRPLLDAKQRGILPPLIQLPNTQTPFN